MGDALDNLGDLAVVVQGWATGFEWVGSKVNGVSWGLNPEGKKIIAELGVYVSVTLKPLARLKKK